MKVNCTVNVSGLVELVGRRLEKKFLRMMTLNVEMRPGRISDHFLFSS